MLAAFPIVAVGGLVLWLGVDVPYWDGWDWLARHYDGREATLVERYWPLHFGHRMFVPFFVVRGIYALTHVDMRALLVATWATQLATLWVLSLLLPPDWTRRQRLFTVAGLSALLFAITLWPAWIDHRQFASGLATMCSVIALWAIARASGGWGFAVALAATIAASLSYFQGTLTWLLWAPLVYRRFPGWPAAVWTGAAAIVLSLHGLELVARDAMQLEPSAFGTPLFALAVLGSPLNLSASPVVSALAALAGLAAFGALAVTDAGNGGRLDHRTSTPWLWLGLWGMSIALATAVGRSAELPLTEALARRYATTVMPFWCSLLALASTAVVPASRSTSESGGRSIFAARAVVVSLSAGLLLGTVRSVSDRRFFDFGERLQMGRSCLVEDRADDACLELLFPDASRIRGLVPVLRQHGAAFAGSDEPAGEG